MANPTALALHAAGAEVGNGTGTSVDIGTLRKCARLTLDVLAIAAGAELVVEVETSPDDATWRSAHASTIKAVTLEPIELIVGGLLRYVRAKWTLTGASATFALTGEAHVLYVTPARLASVIVGAALKKASDDDKLAACLAVTGWVDGLFAKAYTLPITAWPYEVEVEAARIVVGRLMDRVGADPMDSEPDQSIANMLKSAEAFFREIGAGKRKPDGLVDSTPEVEESAFYVARGTPRGW